MSSVPCAACWDFIYRPAPFALASRTVVCTCSRQRFGERAPASRILLTVMPRGVGRSPLFMFSRDKCKLYVPAPPPLPPCPLSLPKLLPRHRKKKKVNDCWFEKMLRLVALSHGGESVSVLVCSCDRTDILYYLSSVPRPLPRAFCSQG